MIFQKNTHFKRFYQLLSLDNWLWEVWVAFSGEGEYLTYIALSLGNEHLWQGIGIWYQMWLMIHTSAKEGSVCHKVGCGIIQRAPLTGLLGINWPVSPVAPSIAVTLLGTLRFVHVITLEVLRSKCVAEKLHWPKNTLACAFPIVSHLGCWVSCVALVPADWDETHLLKSLRRRNVLRIVTILLVPHRHIALQGLFSWSLIYRFLHT